MIKIIASVIYFFFVILMHVEGFQRNLFRICIKKKTFSCQLYITLTYTIHTSHKMYIQFDFELIIKCNKPKFQFQKVFLFLLWQQTRIRNSSVKGVFNVQFR